MLEKIAFKKLFMASCAFAALSACQSTVDSFQGISLLPTDGVVEDETAAISVNLALDTETGELLGASSIQVDDGRYRIETEGGEIIEVAVTAPANTSTWSIPGDQVTLPTSDVNGFQKNDRSATAFLNLTNEYTLFGAWLVDNGDGTGSANAIFAGTETPTGGTPRFSEATYRGTSTGVAGIGTELYMTTSDVEMETDFATGTFVSENTRGYDAVTGAQTDLAVLDLTQDVTIDRHAFSGVTEGGGVGTGAAGSFYGPNAEEFGGTMTYFNEGTDTSYVAAFGGNR